MDIKYFIQPYSADGLTNSPFTRGVAPDYWRRLFQ